MHFESERDAQLVRLLRRAGRGFVIATLAAVLLALAVRSEIFLVLAVVTGALGGACLWTLRVTRYEITPERLRIRSGPHRMAIRWGDLLRVAPSRDRRNAPALSYDRLQLDYRHGRGARTVLISPVRRLDFLRAVQQHAGLVSSGEAWVQQDATASHEAHKESQEEPQEE